MKHYRSINSLLIISMVFVAIGLSSTPVVAQDVFPGIDRQVLYVPGELIVRYDKSVKQTTALASAMHVAQKMGGQMVDYSRNSSLLSFDENADIEKLSRQIKLQPGVAKVEPNYIRWIPEANPMGFVQEPSSIKFRSADGSTRDIPLNQLKQMKSLRKVNGVRKSVPTYPRESYDQWGWWQVRADIIWPEKKSSPAVCVIDTGIDIRHPDFKKGLKYMAVNGYDFVNDDKFANDDNGHGTHVAGTIAAVMNNKIGLSGISNGKVVAVKVLSAQGWGTSWDISMGIRYCADRTDVKVINMSLGGGYPSSEEYAALEYAVNDKNKLVVAAAGNESTSYLSFPGAWASTYVCPNGIDEFPSECVANTIDQGMLSVGATGSPYAFPSPDPYHPIDGDDDVDTNDDGYLWVDTNGNTLEDVTDDQDPAFWDEHFYPEQCATWFSNFGQWVEIVAPGQDILSTVPVKYPFYDEYYYSADGDNDGYEWFSGTSMATPHVAAGAARAWSVNPTYTNAQIEDLLLSTGDQYSMEFASDPNINVPENGYLDDGYSGEGPYCWPNFGMGTSNDTSNAVYLNVAGAMNRGEFWVGIYDAITGLPIPGAKVSAFLSGTTILKDQTKVVYDWEGYVPLLNLPGNQAIDIKVIKTGYTYGNVRVAWQTTYPGYSTWGPWLEVGVPPKNGRIHAVLNFPTYSGDMDFFTWTPEIPGIVVGPWDPGSGYYLDAGDLKTIPFARWNRDGAFLDWLGMESISIRGKPGSTSVPYFNLSSTDHYDFLVTDFGSGALNDYVILRMWANGRIIGMTEKLDVCDSNGIDDISGNDDDEAWWHAGYMTGKKFYSSDICGIGNTQSNDPGGVWPYKIDHTISSMPEYPVTTK